MTTMAHTWKPSPAQVEFLKNVFAERVPTDEPNREQFWKNLTQNISNRASFETAINALKERPRVVRTVEVMQDNGLGKTVPLPVAPDLSGYKLATEAGLYRDPSDGTLYRLSVSEPKRSWERPTVSLSVYSNKAVYRRLTPEGRMVKKGKWNRLKAHERDALLHFSWSERKGRTPVGKKVLASWLLSDEEKLEWAVGFCMMCTKPLIDAVSVWNSIGPVCAKNWGVELQMPPEA